MPGSRPQSQADSAVERTKHRTEAEDEAHSAPEGPGPSHLTKSALPVLRKRHQTLTAACLRRLLQCALSSPRRPTTQRKGLLLKQYRCLTKHGTVYARKSPGRREGNTELQREPEEPASVSETLQRPEKLVSREGGWTAGPMTRMLTGRAGARDRAGSYSRGVETLRG